MLVEVLQHVLLDLVEHRLAFVSNLEVGELEMKDFRPHAPRPSSHIKTKDKLSPHASL